MHNTQLPQAYPTIKQTIAVFGIFLLMSVAGSSISVFSMFLGKDVVNLLMTLVVDGGVIFTMLKIRFRQTHEPFVWNQAMPRFGVMGLVIVASMVLSIAFIEPVVNLLPMPAFFRELMEEALGHRSVYSFLAVVVAAPLLEEFIFRGIVLKGLLKNYSPFKAILVSSVLFGLVHLNPWQFWGALVSGLFMGWIYYRTRNIWYTVGYHFTNNLLSFILNMDKDTMDNTFSQSVHLEAYEGMIIAGAALVFILILWYLHRSLPYSSDEDATVM